MRKYLLPIIGVLLLGLSCEKKEQEVPVSSVSMSQATAEMVVGETISLSATVLPSNATEKTVSWASSNQSVATVAGGKVIAVSEGQSTITASAGGKSATCIVTVSKKTIDVASVELNKTELSLTEGESETLIAAVKPDDATDKTVTWSTSDKTIATVENGKVTAVKFGEATILVTTTDGNKTATCTVTVKYAVPQPVDLGLSVNWASFNVGASTLEGFGDYFAWGEISGKSDYSWSTYRWGDGTVLKKYNFYSGYGDEDYKSVLEKEDDAASVHFGEKWRTPTYEEYVELRERCVWTWKKIGSATGYEISSIITGNAIFLPMAGFKSGTDHVTEIGRYWSSSLATNKPEASRRAYAPVFFEDFYERGSYERFVGLPVRAVTGNPNYVPVSEVSLSKTLLELKEGESEQLKATVLPVNATDKRVTWSTSDVSIATVSDGKVTAVKAGEAVITAKAGEKSATCKVVVKKTIPSGAVDLGLSVYWASCNIGASTPEEYGDYFAWGETEPKEDYSWSTYKFGTSSFGPFSKYNTKESYGPVDNKTVLDPEDDVASVKLGGKWRMPTDAEWEDLRTKCTWAWTTQNGINGQLVTASNGNSIFLPAAGSRDGTDLFNAGSTGLYWSSSLDSGNPFNAWLVRFVSGGKYRNYYDRCSGFSVRPVSE
jgi:uncharacterized protein YjdB